MNAPFRSRPEFLRGRAGERSVAGLLQRQGWMIVPSYDYAGEDGEKVPRMHGALRAFVIPDLDVCRGGQRRWVEVKTKSRADRFRRDGTMNHGFAERHYQDYAVVARESGCAVWLVVVEENTGEILSARLFAKDGTPDLPVHHRYRGDKMDRGGTVFFDRRILRVIGNVSQAAGAP